MDAQLAVASYQMVVNASQDRASVNATVEAFGRSPVSTSGTITVNGSLTLAGLSRLAVSGQPFEFEIADWTTNVNDKGEVTGKFTLITRVTGVTDDYRLYCDILSLKKNGSVTIKSDPALRSVLPR